jgi:hypothetical protein
VKTDELEFPDVSVAEVLAVMDELGRAKFDAALNLVRARKAMAMAEQLRAEKEGLAAHDGN